MIFRLPPVARVLLGPVVDRLSFLEGKPVYVRFRANMGRVHAGSDMPRRRMVLETDLLRHPLELRRIVIHEAYHFVWVRLGNPRRRTYESLVARELEQQARGELGWSAEALKNRLTPNDRKLRSRLWRDYVCESFCDTAAWKYAGLPDHEEWTLALRFRVKRSECLAGLLEGRILPA